MDIEQKTEKNSMTFDNKVLSRIFGWCMKGRSGREEKRRIMKTTRETEHSDRKIERIKWVRHMFKRDRVEVEIGAWAATRGEKAAGEVEVAKVLTTFEKLRGYSRGGGLTVLGGGWMARSEAIVCVAGKVDEISV